MSENVKIENEAYNENYFPQIPSLGISFLWSRNIKGTKQHDAAVLVVVKNSTINITKTVASNTLSTLIKFSLIMFSLKHLTVLRPIKFKYESKCTKL